MTAQKWWLSRYTSVILQYGPSTFSKQLELIVGHGGEGSSPSGTGPDPDHRAPFGSEPEWGIGEAAIATTATPAVSAAVPKVVRDLATAGLEVVA